MEGEKRNARVGKGKEGEEKGRKVKRREREGPKKAWKQIDACVPIYSQTVPAHCSAGVVMSAIPATGQARSLCHGQTATSKKL